MKTIKEHNKVVLIDIDCCETQYEVADEAKETLTVEELRGLLEDFDDEAPVYLFDSTISMLRNINVESIDSFSSDTVIKESKDWKGFPSELNRW